MKKKSLLVKMVVFCMLLTSCGEEAETTKTKKKETKPDNVVYWEDVLVEETLTEETIIGW